MGSAFWTLVLAVPFLYFLKEVALRKIIHIVIIDCPLYYPKHARNGLATPTGRQGRSLQMH
jgi:hypothetical protein